MSPFASSHTLLLVPATHYSLCFDPSVKDIFINYLIGTEICYRNKQLFTMENSSDSDTDVDELSATFVNVVVVDSQDTPVGAASTSTATGLQLNPSQNDTIITNDVPPQVEPDQYQLIRLDERLWNTRMQDEGCEKAKLPKKRICNQRYLLSDQKSHHYFIMS